MFNSSLLTVEMVPPRAHESLSPVPHDGRTKNARAQARHREKRKAYIRQLEETLSRLQAAMSLTGDRIETIPSSLARMRELERENQRLRAEVQSLRRHVTECLHTHTTPNAVNTHSESPGQRKRPRSDDYTYLRTTANFALEQITPAPQRGTPGTLDSSLGDRGVPFQSFTPTPSNDSSASSTHSTPSMVADNFAPPVNVYVADRQYSEYAPHQGTEAAYVYSPNHDNNVFPKQEYVEDRLASNAEDPTPTQPQYTSALCHNAYSGWAVQNQSERRSVISCV